MSLRARGGAGSSKATLFLLEERPCLLMTIYRLVKAEYTGTALRGSRGRGRWHRQGTPMVYAADQPATALLETLVHAGRAELIRVRFVLFRISFDKDEHLVRLPSTDLPEDWQAWPWPESTQEIGTYWHESQTSVALEVPSAVAPVHKNYLLNAGHPAFSDVQIRGPEDFPIDMRLVQE